MTSSKYCRRCVNYSTEPFQSIRPLSGPESYREPPRLLADASGGSNAINVQLSLDETYAEVQPIRVDAESRTAFM